MYIIYLIIITNTFYEFNWCYQQVTLLILASTDSMKYKICCLAFKSSRISSMRSKSKTNYLNSFEIYG